MNLNVHSRDGQDTGRTVDLSPAVFDIEPNDHVLWLDVKAIQANGRQGTHKAKERGDVRGGGAKPWRQKGTGRARAGTSRSPLWVGGGTIFGPRPRNYRQRLNKKTKQLARRSALTYKARESAIYVVEDFSLDTPKTREIVNLVAALELAGKKALILTPAYDEALYKSGRNLPKTNVRAAGDVSTRDVLDAQVVIALESAVDVLNRQLGDEPQPAEQ
ncbi:MAG: 50S ribosomal protein L4 [Bacteroidota bacterium]